MLGWFLILIYIGSLKKPSVDDQKANFFVETPKMSSCGVIPYSFLLYLHTLIANAMMEVDIL